MTDSWAVVRFPDRAPTWLEVVTAVAAVVHIAGALLADDTLIPLHAGAGFFSGLILMGPIAASLAGTAVDARFQSTTKRQRGAFILLWIAVVVVATQAFGLEVPASFDDFLTGFLLAYAVMVVGHVVSTGAIDGWTPD